MSKAIEAEAGTPLNIRSNGTLNVKSFREITMASQGGHVHILAQGPGHDITLLAATSIPTLAPFVETTVRGGGDGVFMHLDDIPRPDAVPIAGQLSFTVCMCNDATLYLVQGNATCADTLSQYLVSPC